MGGDEEDYVELTLVECDLQDDYFDVGLVRDSVAGVVHVDSSSNEPRAPTPPTPAESEEPKGPAPPPAAGAAPAAVEAPATLPEQNTRGIARKKEERDLSAPVRRLATRRASNACLKGYFLAVSTCGALLCITSGVFLHHVLPSQRADSELLSTRSALESERAKIQILSDDLFAANLRIEDLEKRLNLAHFGISNREATIKEVTEDFTAKLSEREAMINVITDDFAARLNEREAELKEAREQLEAMREEAAARPASCFAAADAHGEPEEERSSAYSFNFGARAKSDPKEHRGDEAPKARGKKEKQKEKDKEKARKEEKKHEKKGKDKAGKGASSSSSSSSSPSSSSSWFSKAESGAGPRREPKAEKRGEEHGRDSRTSEEAGDRAERLRARFGKLFEKANEWAANASRSPAAERLRRAVADADAWASRAFEATGQKLAEVANDIRERADGLGAHFARSCEADSASGKLGKAACDFFDWMREGPGAHPRMGRAAGAAGAA
eukprot:tig00020960_g16585.t1